MDRDVKGNGMNKIFQVESISTMHELFNCEKPTHPLISLIDLNKIEPDPSYLHERLIMGLYSVSLKNGMDCEMKYGRQSYDFNEGSMVFMAPGQTTVAEYSELEKSTSDNWMLLFHPELIRGNLLDNKMGDYHFFDYQTNEALQLSDDEKRIVTDIVYAIKREYSGNQDNHSLELMLSYIMLLLNYCNRFYGRQFITRSSANHDVLIRFEELLKAEVGSAEKVPNVKYLADQIGYSPSYLSDLLKKETGKTAQEHIQLYLTEKAKQFLKGTDDPIYQIAYQLGFEHATHFSKFFKSQTGQSPSSFRKIS